MKGKAKAKGAGVQPRPIRGTHIKTGEKREFPSMMESARQVNGRVGNIWSVCQGRLNQSAGIRWEYI